MSHCRKRRRRERQVNIDMTEWNPNYAFISRYPGTRFYQMARSQRMVNCRHLRGLFLIIPTIRRWSSKMERDKSCVSCCIRTHVVVCSPRCIHRLYHFVHNLHFNHRRIVQCMSGQKLVEANYTTQLIDNNSLFQLWCEISKTH